MAERERTNQKHLPLLNYILFYLFFRLLSLLGVTFAIVNKVKTVKSPFEVFLAHGATFERLFLF